MRILSIEVGYGEASLFFTTDPAVKAAFHTCDKIYEQELVIGKGLHNDLTLNHYIVVRGDKQLAQIEAGSGITLRYSTEEESSLECEVPDCENIRFGDVPDIITMDGKGLKVCADCKLADILNSAKELS